MKFLKNNFPLRITFYYVLFSGIWISSSDWLLGVLFTNPKTISQISMFKGWLFIIVTASILFLLMQQELSSRKAMEEKVKKSELLFRSILQHSPVPMGLYNDQGKIEILNESFINTFGYTTDEIPEMETWWQRAYPDEKYRSSVRNVKVPRSISPLNPDQVVLLFQKQERLITCKDGSRRNAELYGISIKDKIFVILIDTTEQKRTQDALQVAVKHHQELAQIVNSSPSVVFLWKISEGWPVEFVSENVTQFGYTPDEFYNDIRFYSSVVYPDDLPRIAEEVAQYLQNNVDQFSQEYRIINRSGEIRWVEDRTWPRRDVQGNITHMQGVVFDITDRKLAEEEIKKLNADLERRVEERTSQLQNVINELESFSYSISHDLRAPLRSLDGFSQILLEDYHETLDETGKDYLQRIRASSQHMSQLIDALLQLSRITRKEMTVQQINLSNIASEVRAELQNNNPQRVVEWVIQPNVVVSGDPVLMRVVLTNLLGNAWKFTMKTASPHIEFGQIEKEGRMVCFVRDNGAGFDMVYADKLFRAFQRLHSPVDFEGSGIGLALVQRIIHRHNGRIWAYSEINKGAAFYFYTSVAVDETQFDR